MSTAAMEGNPSAEAGKRDITSEVSGSTSGPGMRPLAAAVSGSGHAYRSRPQPPSRERPAAPAQPLAARGPREHPGERGRRRHGVAHEGLDDAVELGGMRGRDDAPGARVTGAAAALERFHRAGGVRAEH